MTSTALRGTLAALLGAAFVTGCGVPLKWKRVDGTPPTPIQGVRYVLRRPAYEASIGFIGDPKQAPELLLHVTQTMNGEPIVYETTSRVNPLADTHAEIKIAEDGGLTGLSGGEKDRSLEVIEAGLGLARSAMLADAQPEKDICIELRESAEQRREFDLMPRYRKAWPPPSGRENACTKLHGDIFRHIETKRVPIATMAIATECRSRDEEAKLRDALGQGRPAASSLLRNLQALRAEHERLTELLRADRFALEGGAFSVSVTDRGPCAPQGCKPFRVHGGEEACIQVMFEAEEVL